MDPLYALTTNSQLYWSRVENSEDCFEPNASLAEPVHIVDVPATAKPKPSSLVPLRRKECTSLKVLEDYLEAPSNATFAFRLVSICQNNSWSRLNITKSMLRKLVEHHDVDSSFLEVALSFFYRNTDEEQSFCVPWTKREDDASIQSFYTFRYAEHKGHPNEPWVIRQAGVYQKFDIRTKTSLYILINAVPDSAAHRRVLESLERHQSQLQSSPLWLHGVIHASYFMRWREYIAEYEKRLLPIVGTTTSTFINKPLRVSYDTLGRVRALEGRFLPIRAILASFEDVADGLEDVGNTLVAKGCVGNNDQQQVASQLGNARRYARTFTRTAMFLQQRSNSTATLLADTLAFRNQGVAQEQNGSMIILTRSAVFITVITLIYLPWTLVTGIFGMEFFEMDQETQRLMTSPQIWIYFITATAATIVTVVLYWVMAGFPQIRGTSRDDSEEVTDIHVPQSLQRGYTDIEKSPKCSELQGLDVTGKAMGG